MIRSESNTELLKLPDHSTPSKVEEFTVPTIGGGFIVVKLYGDFVVSMGCIDIGIMGKDWVDTEAALDAVVLTASTMNDKCMVTDLSVGGCAMMLYFNSEELDTPSNRRRLCDALAKTLPDFVQTNILCLPGKGFTMTDMVNLSKASETWKTLVATADSNSAANAGLSIDGGGDENSSDEEKKNDGDNASGHRRKRSNSLTIAAAEFEFPVPSAMITPEAIQENVLVKASAQSAYGRYVKLKVHLCDFCRFYGRPFQMCSIDQHSSPPFLSHPFFDLPFLIVALQC